MKPFLLKHPNLYWENFIVSSLRLRASAVIKKMCTVVNLHKQQAATPMTNAPMTNLLENARKRGIFGIEFTYSQNFFSYHDPSNTASHQHSI